MDYKKIAKKALNEAKKPTKLISEVMRYAEGHSERIDPRLETELRDRKHSLGDHPAFPQGDERSFEQKILADRFEDVMRNYKEKFDCETINNDEVKNIQHPIMSACMEIEKNHKTELEQLAIKMVRDEYNISEDMVDITAELTNNLDLSGTKKEALPVSEDFDFNSHDDIQMANDNVYKRRFLNAMTQGAAKKSSHMFHSVNKELSSMDPRLVSKYGKLMAAADYAYFVEPDMVDVTKENGHDIGKTILGGIVRVTLPTKDNPKCTIHAKGLVFPILVHELVKGVMEILSAHGLPEDNKIAKYVIGKSDFLAAEPWDMRLGPALWDRFTRLINPEDFHLKHNVYSELAALPINDFNRSMREIMAGTKLGKEIIDELVNNTKTKIEDDTHRDDIGDDDSDGFSLNDLDDIDINDLL